MTKAQDQKDEQAAAQVADRAAAERARAEKERSSMPAENQPERKSAPATDTAARLRAFEDEVFGKRAVRINGQIERGVGSPYADMSDERKAQYAALEALVAAEQRLNDATGAAAQAEADRAVAEENLARCEKAAGDKTVEAEKDKVGDEKVAAQDKSETEKTHKEKTSAGG
jgi:hypothetical protein